MGKTVVLAEKPSVGREIARVLGCRKGESGYIEGDRYIVTWALGHLVTLASPEAYDKKYEKWNLEDLPLLPENMRLVVIPESGKQFRVIQSLLKRADVLGLVIATDAGREGELVARWILEKTGWKRPTQRLWISSQTDRAIREGFANLKPAQSYENLFRAARARAMADWLVGLNITRALTCRFNAQLSAGRVQTPTLALIVAREKEIVQFVPKDYWMVSVQTPDYTARWRGKDGKSRIDQKGRAEGLAAKLAGQQGILTQVKKEYRQKPPPAAYDLTELQRDANKKYAYSAKETLSILQGLYESHKVLTYPRTDSRYISDDVADTLPERLRGVCAGEYAALARGVLRQRPLQTKYLVCNAKVTDHHAIIPTEESAELHRFSGPERNIYDLVVRRFLAVLMPPYEYEETTITLTVAGETFVTKGKTVKNSGWQGAYEKDLPQDEEGDEEEEGIQTLPPVRQGDRVTVLGVKLLSGKTKPPPRYTEATLLSAMEHPAKQVQDAALGKVLEQTSGLGTPATRADIIEKLFSTFYIERRGKELVPQSKGIQLMELVPSDLKSAALTARWEQQLTRISYGEIQEAVFLKEMRQFAGGLVREVKESDAHYVPDNVSRERCPDCGKFLLDVKGKRGKMLVCPDRACGYRKNRSMVTNARCPNCHKKLELRGEGEKRIFVCICGHRERLSDFEKRRQSSQASKQEVQTYLRNQEAPAEKSALAEQLEKWKKRTSQSDL